VLDLAGLKPGARYVIFHCADNLGETKDDSGLYYESIDLLDAYHPQTILAYGMNGGPLGPGHGAPLRLYAAVKLGYKMVKYLTEVNFLPAATGGYWEDQGYEWFAGV
jgi:DMSO/TMAO reductase YedYZ molybdopterin-dependent catalytic subunit